MVLSKDDILKADDLKRAEVDCPEWGGSVLVRELTARERDKHEGEVLFAARQASTGEDPDTYLENINARIAALGIIDENGQRLFSQPTDVLALGEKGSSVVTRIADKIGELSGMSEPAQAEIKGNSGAVPSDGSASE